EVADRHAGLRRDGADAGAGGAVFQERLARGVDDLIPRAFGRGGPGHTYVPAYTRLAPDGVCRPVGAIIHAAVRSIDQVFPNRLCGVLRTEDSDAGFQACLAALEGGVRTIEVTKTVPSCFEMIRGLIATTGGRFPIGVGTVWDPGAVREAKEAGASFVVTPVLLPEVADACRQQDILCVLGALSPTEIYQARVAGAALVKV